MIRGKPEIKEGMVGSAPLPSRFPRADIIYIRSDASNSCLTYIMYLRVDRTTPHLRRFHPHTPNIPYLPKSYLLPAVKTHDWKQSHPRTHPQIFPHSPTLLNPTYLLPPEITETRNSPTS